jgi:hypothetical protein
MEMFGMTIAGLSQGLNALLGGASSSDPAPERDRLLDIATLVRTTEFNDIGEIEAAVHAREILAVGCAGAQKYPSFQFKNGKVRTGVVDVLRAAPDVEGSQILEFLERPNTMMFGCRPIDVIARAESQLRLVMIEAEKLIGTSGAGRPG